MDKASLYREANARPRSHTKELIKEFENKLQWQSDGKDSLIDIGCGCGDVTTEFLLPILPTNFSRLVAIDKSPEMIAYAKKHYSQPKVTYDVLDIVDQKKITENIYKLLKPNGDFLLWFLAKGSMYDAYEVLAKNSMWSEYVEDYVKFLSTYHHSQNIVGDHTEIIRDAGFVDFGFEFRDVEAEFESADEIKKLMIALDPFINRIPKEVQYEYVNDLISELRHDQFKYIVRMKVLVAYGRKGKL